MGGAAVNGCLCSCGVPAVHILSALASVQECRTHRVSNKRLRILRSRAQCAVAAQNGSRQGTDLGVPQGACAFSSGNTVRRGCYYRRYMSYTKTYTRAWGPIHRPGIKVKRSTSITGTCVPRTQPNQ
jgi:hypothetical protein